MNGLSVMANKLLLEIRCPSATHYLIAAPANVQGCRRQRLAAMLPEESDNPLLLLEIRHIDVALDRFLNCELHMICMKLVIDMMRSLEIRFSAELTHGWAATKLAQEIDI
jgi:hypothetical protein